EVNVRVSQSVISFWMSGDEACFSVLLFDKVGDVESCGVSWEVAKFCTEFRSNGLIFFKVVCEIYSNAIFLDHVRPLTVDLGDCVVTLECDVGGMPLADCFNSDVFDFTVCAEMFLYF